MEYELTTKICVRCGKDFRYRNTGNTPLERQTSFCPKCSTQRSGGTRTLIADRACEGVFVESPSGFIGVIQGKWQSGQPITVRWQNGEVRTYHTRTNSPD